jgi:hypothetical protein
MHPSALPRPLAAIGLVAAAALLSGCNPCDYTVDAYDTQKKQVQTSDSGYKNSGFSKEVYERMQRENAEAEAKMTPEQRAAREEIKRKMREQSEAGAKARADKIAAGYDPAKDPMVRFRKATLTECSMHYGSAGFVWLLGLLVLGGGAHVVSKRLTGRSLASWLTGKKPA